MRTGVGLAVGVRVAVGLAVGVRVAVGLGRAVGSVVASALGRAAGAFAAEAIASAVFFGVAEGFVSAWMGPGDGAEDGLLLGVSSSCETAVMVGCFPSAPQASSVPASSRKRLDNSNHLAPWCSLWRDFTLPQIRPGIAENWCIVIVGVTCLCRICQR